MNRLGTLLLAALIPGHAACAQQPAVAKARRANIVFTGTVTQVGAASFAAVTATPRTLVVRVEDVLDKPQALRMAAGDSVTVEPLDSTHTRGQRATFYTTGWVFGRGIAVREVAHDTTSSQQPAARRDSFRQLERQVTDSDLADRVHQADMIVVGRVESVGAPTGMATPTHRRITEHDADWQEAVIVVDSMVKGPAGTARVAVRFPASRDIAWHQFPKFTSGQAGTFLLRRDTLSGSPRAMVSGRAVPAYNVVAGADVLGAGDAARVRAMVKQ